MRLVRWTAPVMALALWTPVLAQDVFPDIEYVSGRAGQDRKIKGMLVVSETEVSFVTKKMEPVFAIPMGDVKEASNSVEDNPGSFGRKLALGIFAGRKDEFFYLNWENEQGAEGLVFKTKSKMSPGIVAKVRFYARKLSPAADSVVAATQPPAEPVTDTTGGSGGETQSPP